MIDEISSYELVSDLTVAPTMKAVGPTMKGIGASSTPFPRIKVSPLSRRRNEHGSRPATRGADANRAPLELALAQGLARRE